MSLGASLSVALGAAQLSWCSSGSDGSDSVGEGGDRGADGGEGIEKGLEGGVVDVCHGGGDDVLDFWEHLVEHGLGVGRYVDEDSAAVVGVGDTFDVTVAFERVEDAGHRSGGDVHSDADFAGGNGAAGAFDDGERVECSVGQAVTAGDGGDELLGLAADDFELADRARG
jgi:hypothetical protein